MANAPAKKSKGINTQWAAQFLVAAELTRRGYTVSFTMGNNTPFADLMVGAPTGKQFWVDVKGLAQKSPWLLRPKSHHPELYYVLVYLTPLANQPNVRQPDRFSSSVNQRQTPSSVIMRKRIRVTGERCRVLDSTTREPLRMLGTKLPV